MLIDQFDNIAAEPFTSGGFADLYRATYKGQSVVAKTLKAASVHDVENATKVSSLTSSRDPQSAYIEPSALGE